MLHNTLWRTAASSTIIHIHSSTCWVVKLSRHLNCETGVSWILWSRALLLWSVDTCLWCPHTQPHSGSLHHMSETQISSEDRENWPATIELILFLFLYWDKKKRYIFITWLFFPSSFGTSQLRTETNLDSRWRTEISIKFSLTCNFTFYKQKK